jgi:3-carboxy-cis,cis-muconate cycloisomerase
LDALFRDPEMVAIFSPDATVRRMLKFEAALARAEARAGVIPVTAATAIVTACETVTFDAGELFRDAVSSGTPVIPLVRLITEHAANDATAFVHMGTTSQDTIDTAIVLLMRDGINLLVASLGKISIEAARLARDHRHTLMAGRTLLQQAVPITFGLKAARWLHTTIHLNQKLITLRTETLAIQFGGAAGTLAALGAKGPEVATLLAEELDLPEPLLPWHAERERIAEVATTMGIVAGSMAKIAADLTLLQQSEIAEISPGSDSSRGGSSAIPQKRNPVDATLTTAAARLAIGDVTAILNSMAHAHERAPGEWQAEWEAIANLFSHTASAVNHVQTAIKNLVVNDSNMRTNLNSSGGIVMAESISTALAEKIGRQDAFRLTQEIVQTAVSEGIGFRDAFESNPRASLLLTTSEINRAFNPAAYLGSTDVFIDRVLANFDALKDQ